MESRFEKELNLWLERCKEDEDVIAELKKIEHDEKEVEDRFYKNLNFGTAGMRGVMGAGPNRMNIFVVRAMTQAFCEYLKKHNKNCFVAIGYDSRNKSKIFAIETARVFAANDVLVYFYEELACVPMLSFAVRCLKCAAGVMITASHNPAEYNGYKVYDSDGSQLRKEAVEEIYKISKTLDIFNDVKKVNFLYALREGKIRYVSYDVYERYREEVAKTLIHKDVLKLDGFKVLYTPLNGAGKKPVEDIFKRMGVLDFFIVEEQKDPDGNFATCKYPNPETKEALTLGLRDCRENKPDILIATDPDCDRLGVAVKDKNEEYVILTGNEIGILMFYYICKERSFLKTMPKNPVAVKTIVSSNIIEKIAAEFGVTVKNVLTGFKYVGEQIAFLEQEKRGEDFIFGFEESHGYLSRGYVRDKDGVFAALFISEIAAYYKKQNKTLVEVLDEIYDRYGFYVSWVESFVFEGKEGLEKMEKIMNNLRNANLKNIGEFKIKETIDYSKGFKMGFSLEKSNVLEYRFEDGGNLIVRPSGTEPKIKVYCTVVGKKEAESEKLKENLKKSFDLEKYIK